MTDKLQRGSFWMWRTGLKPDMPVRSLGAWAVEGKTIRVVDEVGVTWFAHADLLKAPEAYETFEPLHGTRADYYPTTVADCMTYSDEAPVDEDDGFHEVLFARIANSPNRYAEDE